MPAGVQRAVLAHELWHVRRRDWAVGAVEETIRAAFWFNPAMGWLVSRVQSSREEVVDELTVLLTNARRTYLEALLAFADEPPLFPADALRSPSSPVPPHAADFQGGCDVVQENRCVERRDGRRVARDRRLWLVTCFRCELRLPSRQSAASSQQAPPRDRRPARPGRRRPERRELKNSIAAELGDAGTVLRACAAPGSARRDRLKPRRRWRRPRAASGQPIRAC